MYIILPLLVFFFFFFLWDTFPSPLLSNFPLLSGLFNLPEVLAAARFFSRFPRFFFPPFARFGLVERPSCCRTVLFYFWRDAARRYSPSTVSYGAKGLPSFNRSNPIFLFLFFPVNDREAHLRATARPPPPHTSNWDPPRSQEPPEQFLLSQARVLMNSLLSLAPSPAILL